MGDFGLVHVLIGMMLECLLQVCSSDVRVGSGRENVEDIVETALFHRDGDMFPFVLESGRGVS